MGRVAGYGRQKAAPTASAAAGSPRGDDDEIFDFTCVSRQHYRAKTHAGNRAPEPSIHESITQE